MDSDSNLIGCRKFHILEDIFKKNEQPGRLSTVE